MTDLVRDVERIVVRRQADVRLLLAVRSERAYKFYTPHIMQVEDSPDEGIDLRSLNIVQLLYGVLDLTLVGLDVNDEHQGVVLLNLLHR